MGPESRRRDRAPCGPSQQREGREGVGRHGYEKGAEGSACWLQDPAGNEGCGGVAKECYGEEYVPPHLFYSFCGNHANSVIVNKKSLVKEVFGADA